MSMIKDRLKLFEANDPPIKPTPNVKTDIANPTRKLSNRKSGINNAVVNEVNRTGISSPNTNSLIKEEKTVVDDNYQKQMNGNLSINRFHSTEKSEKITETNLNIKNELIDSDNECIDKMHIDVNIDKPNKEKSNEINLKENNGDKSICSHEKIEANTNKNSKTFDIQIEESSDRDSVDDFTYEFNGSVYHLPGLENFIFNECEHYETDLIKAIPSNETDFTIVEEHHVSPTVEKTEINIEEDVNVLMVANNLKRSASKKLIEEIFNASVNYNNNFIISPPTVTDSNNENEFSSYEKIADISSTISSSLPNDERRKSTQSLSTKPMRRSIFSGIFRSKRDTKKSHEKSKSHYQANEVYNLDGNHEVIDKTNNHSKLTEGDTDSTELVTKKPLNSIFNRDWLNSLGEGIKKKANVMAELKKVFSHGKGKNLKKKPQKAVTGGTIEVSSGNRKI